MDSVKKDKAKIKLAVKKYTPPVLIVYGKLSEITASGTSIGVEGAGVGNETKTPMA